MMKKTFILGAFMAMSMLAAAQPQIKNGGISPQMLQEIQKTQPSSANKALANAIAGNSIDNLAKNFKNQGAFDTNFSVETPRQSIHDQKSSGRCWMFTGFNVLRSDFALRTDSLVVEFSYAYLFFWDQLEKANLMLQGVIDNAKLSIEDPKVQFFFKHPINDGGTFCGVSDLVDKYGLVPMSIQPETFSAENTSKMQSLISSKLREYGLELRNMVNKKAKAANIMKRKTEMLATVYNMLSLTLGEPVKEFNYAFANKKGQTATPVKRYTPKSFAQEVVGRQLNGTFIMAMNDPRRPYYKTYEVEYDRHTYDGHNWKYINLPMEDIAKMAIATLKDGRKMYSSYDVGKQLDRKRGYSALDNFDYATLFNTTFPMNKADRIATFDSGSTHAMTLTAVDLDAQGNPIKWKVENSWGASNGHNGCIIMTNEWFNEYSFRLVVDKKYVPEDILKAEQQKPIMLTADDPLFQYDE
ncbi:MAG: C1 family peptidase [Prevotella sp.]|nr:C1 family peptidase [Prevotella sp.]